MQENGKKLVNSFLWSAIHRFGTKILLFVSNLVLARLLSPSDFGYAGIILVFVEFSNIFINGGFASALIQKKNTTQIDYSSVFFVNLLLSLLFFLLFFFSASSIASFYQSPILCDILRVQGVVLIFNAFNVVQINVRQKNMEFRQIAIAENIACIVSCVAGIVAAIAGCGVWSFVVKNIGHSMLYSLILWFWDSWRPSFIISLKSIRELFNFGGFILLTTVVDAIYGKIQPLLIGKVFSENDLGFFTQGRKFQDNITMSITHMLSSVSYPLYSKLQDDKESLLLLLRRNIKAISYINFPLMVSLIIMAEPLIIILFGEKWLPSVPYFRVLCAEGMIMVVNITNRDVFSALGKSRMYFRVQLAYEFVGIILIFIGMQYGVLGFVCGRVAAFYVLFLISASVMRWQIGYGFIAQIVDMTPSVLLSLFAGLVSYFVSLYVIHLNVFAQVLVIGSVFYVIFILSSALSRNESFMMYRHLVVKYIGRFIPWIYSHK